MNVIIRCFPVAKVLGLFLVLFSISLLSPIGIALFYKEHTIFPFFLGFLITITSGLILWLPLARYQRAIRLHDGFLVVTLCWFVLSAFAALPILFLSPLLHLGFTDAMFESVSGLTTTGATALSHLDRLPRSFLYYRQQLQLLGGMGIIVLAVAILPMLGVGGMQLYRAEIVGPVKTNKLHPRIAQTAKALWYIYMGLIVLCTLSYWLAGMPLFDAVMGSFSTVATGGFSIHDNSFAFYHSPLIDGIAIVFMLAGAANFSLHFLVVQRRQLSVYYHDDELRAYLLLLATVSFIVACSLVLYRRYPIGHAIINALFTVVSIGTTTGFTNSHFDLWPSFLPYLIMLLALIGGCSGSTSAGIKILRLLMMKAQGVREFKRLLHPQSIPSMRLGHRVLSESVVQSIWGFLSVFVAVFIILLFSLLATGLDLRSAYGAIASCLGNTGASIGALANHFYTLPITAKWILIFAMISGRLEVFTVLILFMPGYWKR